MRPYWKYVPPGTVNYNNHVWFVEKVTTDGYNLYEGVLISVGR